MEYSDSSNNTNLDLVVIVVPIYGAKLENHEIISLNQCFKKLSKYPISFICADDFSIHNHGMLLKGAGFHIERFSHQYFESIQGYNRLMLSKDFYERFKQYRFMLVHQLDAFVFRDELEYWCAMDYDYIGAPWFEGYNVGDKNSKMLPFAGNGGFSLRKVSSYIKVLEEVSKHKTIKINSVAEIWDSYKNRSLVHKIVRIPKMILAYLSKKNNLRYYLRNGILPEDVVFVELIAKIYRETFVVSTSDIAAKFSFEYQARRLYELNKEQLPFGCHRWQQNEVDFWRPHIEAEGYSLH